MSEMKNMMYKKLFLEVCLAIERLCADLYHRYSTLYEDVPGASSVWKKAALDEENHKRQFEQALKAINETEFEVQKLSLERAYTIHYKLLKLRNHVQNATPELLTAVSKAVEMEEELADLHTHISPNFKDEAMQGLFTSLAEAGKKLIATLQHYRNILQTT